MDADFEKFLNTFDSKPSKEFILILKPVFVNGFTSGANAAVQGIREEILYG